MGILVKKLVFNDLKFTLSGVLEGPFGFILRCVHVPSESLKNYGLMIIEKGREL